MCQSLAYQMKSAVQSKIFMKMHTVHATSTKLVDKKPNVLEYIYTGMYKQNQNSTHQISSSSNLQKDAKQKKLVLPTYSVQFWGLNVSLVLVEKHLNLVTAHAFVTDNFSHTTADVWNCSANTLLGTTSLTLQQGPHDKTSPQNTHRHANVKKNSCMRSFSC